MQKTRLFFFASIVALITRAIHVNGSKKAPNVLIFFVDDMGYGDLGCQGNATVQSPNIDFLGNEGVRFTQWISASSICTPSRGALLTGRQPIRLGLASGFFATRVLMPLSPGGLPLSEHTLAEALKERGYNTHMTGKWHLGIGDRGRFLPTNHGFDHFYGLGITNIQTCMPGKTIYKQNSLATYVYDQTYYLWISLAAASVIPFLMNLNANSLKRSISLLIVTVCLFYLITSAVYYLSVFNPAMCILYKDSEIIQQPFELDNLTQRNTANAKGFLSFSQLQAEPFFLYMSYVKMHTALFSNPEFKKHDEVKHPEMAYVNNIDELDWSVGEIITHLKGLGLYEDTLIWFTSDNGPFLERGVEGGSKKFTVEEDGKAVEKSLRGGKTQVWEGGIRVPGIAVYKPYFPSQTVTNEVISTMDIFPTTLSIIDSHLESKGNLPDNLTYTKSRPHTIIDGEDMSELIANLGSSTPVINPHETLIHYCGDTLSAVRIDGRYKAYFYTPIYTEVDAETCNVKSACQCQGSSVDAHDPPLLFDLDLDVQERHVLTPQNFKDFEDVIRRVAVAVEHHTKSIEKFPNQPDQMEHMWRPWLLKDICCNFPNCSCDKEADPSTYFYS